MKKYLLILAIGLFSTAAVTASMIDSADKKEVKKEKKQTEKKQCTKVKRSCIFG
jgi:hypothetical protein